MEEAVARDEVVVRERGGKYSVRFKQYLRDEDGNMRKGKPLSILRGPYTQAGTKEITELLGKGVMDFPKPSGLMRYLFSTIVNEENSKDGIFVDFFAGSCTSAHALLDLNAEDGGSRRFVCIQIGGKDF